MGIVAKLLVGGVVVGATAVGYVFWSDLDEGERHHLVDKAKRGDAEGFSDTLKFKADEAMERQKVKAAELAKGAASAVVDEANAQVKLAADRAADDAKQRIAGDAGPAPIVDGGPR